jgi:hypothetical protein
MEVYIQIMVSENGMVARQKTRVAAVKGLVAA